MVAFLKAENLLAPHPLYNDAPTGSSTAEAAAALFAYNPAEVSGEPGLVVQVLSIESRREESSSA